MAARKPLVLVDGRQSQLPSGDTLDATAAAHASSHAPTGSDPVSIAFSRGSTLPSPASTGTTDVWVVDAACTVTAVKGLIRGATGSTVNATRIRSGSSADLLGTDITLSSADTVTDGGAVQNASLQAGDIVQTKIVGLSGSPTSVTVQINLTRP